MFFQLRRKKSSSGKKSKYLSKKCEYKGIKFDSIREMVRYQELLLLEKKGKICELKLQPVFYFSIQGQGFLKSYRSNRKLKYVADFQYVEKLDDGTWKTVVEDVKSEFIEKRIEVFLWKASLMKWIHGIDIRMVR